MSSYPVTIRRCQHIKVNGTQCASPALRDDKHCYFHAQCHRKSTEVKVNVSPNANANTEDLATFTLPTLEDANSIQLGLAEMLRLLATHQIDHKTAGLMLYALQTASANLRKTSFEPEPTMVVIDRECVEQRPIGASAWSTFEGREYDDLLETGAAAEPCDGEASFDSMLSSLIARAAHNTGYPNQRRGTAKALEKK
jgi:hypothetical protein